MWSFKEVVINGGFSVVLTDALRVPEFYASFSLLLH